MAKGGRDPEQVPVAGCVCTMSSFREGRIFVRSLSFREFFNTAIDN